MEANLSPRGAALLASARSALGMEDARDREVLAEALERYSEAIDTLAAAPDVENVDTSGFHATDVHVPNRVHDELRHVRTSLGGTGDTSPGEAAERALAYVSTGATAPADARVPTPGVPPLVAPDPMGALTRDADNPVIDPVFLLVSSVGGGRSG